MTGPNARVFALLEWDARLGAPLELVAVLGVDEDGEHDGFVVEWVPHTMSGGAGWAERLHAGAAAAPTLDPVEDRALDRVELQVPAGARDLRTAVAMTLDALMAAPDELEAAA